MKAIGWIIGLLVLVVVGAGVFLVLRSGDVVKAAVERLGPSYLGVPVSLASADISLTEGAGELRGLVIGNPEGFAGRHSIRIDRAAVTIDPTQISSDLLVIKSLEMDGAEVAIVAKGTRTNLQAIMDNLESGEPATEPAEPASEMKMIIDAFAFTNAKSSLDSDLIGQREIAIPDVHLSGIGRKSSGVSAGEAARQLLAPIVRSTTEAVARQGLGVDDLKKQASEKLQEELGRGLDRLKKSLN